MLAGVLAPPVGMRNQTRDGERRATALFRASTTHRLSIRSPIAQPTIRREERSSTAARYSQPSWVADR